MNDEEQNSDQQPDPEQEQSREEAIRNAPDPVITDALQEILQSAEDDLPVLPEPIFVNEFLPLFAQGGQGVSLNDWMQVAKHPHNSVKVINQQGEELFRVPPILADTSFQSEHEQRKSMYDVAMDAENKARLSPMMGREYLNQELNNRVEHREVDLEVIHTWNWIFERYGYEPIEIPDDVEQWLAERKRARGEDTQPNNRDNNGDDDNFEPDDFEEL